MTSEVISLTDKKNLRVTTLRADPDLLRKARYFLDEENKSINEFLVEQLTIYVRHREQRQAPRKAEECA